MLLEMAKNQRQGTQYYTDKGMKAVTFAIPLADHRKISKWVEQKEISFQRLYLKLTRRFIKEKKL